MPRRPKHPDQLAGHSHGRAGAAADRRASMTKLAADPVAQPSLIKLMGKTNPMRRLAWSKNDVQVEDATWHPQTLELWKELGTFPTMQNLQMAQWMMLARAVALDDAALSDPKTFAAEARLRFSQFGVTPDDLTKMRIQFVAADEAERRGTTRGEVAPQSARQRYGPHLTAVQGGKA
jgi:hypothetical protein